MRLLHFEADKLVLTNFTGKSIPLYAILSHRWTDSEVLFKDVASRKVNLEDEQGVGWQKIKFCAQKAAQHNLEYFWIDSCCIDKWNHTERDRSVNSMFKWYQNSARCFVFLQDVNATGPNSESPQSSWDRSFRASNWFTRGWTLQELIAPSSVDFYDAQGLWLGDKTSLQQLIYEVTDIPKQALNGQVNDFSYDERLQWSSNRVTTEPEDNAYCLLGILGIELSLTYGEGGQRARLRLELELKAIHEAPCVLPFSQNERYIGQEAALAEVEQKLFSEQKLDILVITGESGSGKSSLALEFSHRTRKKRRQCSVFWIDAGTTDSLQQSYSEVARKLKVLQLTDQVKETTAGVHRYLQSEAYQEWLVVYDNLDSESFMSLISSFGSDKGPTSGLPNSDHGSIIITTIDSDLAEKMPAGLITMPELTEESALDILQSHLPDLASAEHKRLEILQLGKLVSRPLAIVIAIAYVRESGIPINEYFKDIQAEIASTTQECLIDRPIQIVISYSLRHIIEHNPKAAECIFLLACFARQDIPLALLVDSTTDELHSSIELLSQYAIITRRPASAAIDVHQLIHYAMIRRLQSTGEFKDCHQRALQRITETFPEPNTSNRSHWRRYLPHAKHLIEHADNKDDPGYLDLLRHCGFALYLDGRWKEAEELQVRVIETSSTVLGQDHPNTLTSIGNLALTYSNQGRWKEAEELQVRVMETSSTVLGQDHPNTLTSMANLASTYSNQGRWKEAEELEVRVIETRKTVLGQDHPNTLTSMANLASTYSNQGRWKEAEELQVRVMETSSTVLGQDHPNTLTSMANLASTYSNQGRWKEAEELQVRVMETSSTVLGQDHPNTLTSMANLASTYSNQGRWKEAEELEVRVIETSSTVLGQDHPNTLTSIGNLALTYSNQGRWKEAEELQVRVMETSSTVLGQDHPNTLTSIGNLALTYSNQGRWKEAEELKVRVMETSSTVLGQDHPNTLTSMANLASTYSNQGRWKEAEELEVRVIETRKTVLGQDHPNTLTSMANLASTYSNQGRWKEAEELQVRVMETSSTVLGQDHPNTLTSMANLASTYSNQGRWKEAEELEVRVIETSSTVLGQDHPNTLTSIGNLALTYSNQGRWKEAEELKVRVMETSSTVLGQDHPDTLTR